MVTFIQDDRKTWTGTRMPTVQKFMWVFLHCEILIENSTHKPQHEYICCVKWPMWKYEEKPNHNTREEQKNTPIKKEHNQREPTTIEPKIHGFSPIVDSQFINSYFVCELLMANNGFVKKKKKKKKTKHTHTLSCAKYKWISRILCDKLGELSATKLH